MEIDPGLAIIVSAIMLSLPLYSIATAIRRIRRVPVERETFELTRLRETIEKVSREWLFYLKYKNPGERR